MGVSESFDLVLREMKIGEQRVALLFIDGMNKDDVTARILIHLQADLKGDLPQRFEKLKALVPYVEVDSAETVAAVAEQVLAGPLALLVDGMNKAVILDLRTYPTRSVEEPDLERVSRGARDGLTETLVLNAALLRRRLRDPALRIERVAVGKRSKTDVAICYIKDIAHSDLVGRVRAHIKQVQVDALPMGGKNLEEFILGTKLNPLPTTRYTERADVAAAHLLEGHVLVMVDTTPAAMILPAGAFHFVQHAEEFFQNPVVGTYLRWVRFLGIALTLALTPVWLALALNPELLPENLRFIGPDKVGNVPLALQFFVLELGIDLIRMALIHTPNALATSLGIVGAILLGELAVEVGLFANEAILYTAVVAIGYFAVPNIEFGLALRLCRYLLLALALLAGLWGVAAGLALLFLVFGFTRSMGMPYLWPLLPLDLPALLRVLFRFPIPSVRHRAFPAAGDRTTGPRDKEGRSR